MNPTYLREATAQEHERVEGTLPLMQEHLERGTYITVLKGFYGFVKGWENWASCHAPESLKPELAQRQRSRMLERDLAFFTEPLPHDVFRPELSGDCASVLGSMYVLEGSTLGGQLIAAHVEKVLGLQRGEGDAFFVGYADQTGTMWKRFKEILAGVPDTEAQCVVLAAKQTFNDFGAWMTKAQPAFHAVSAETGEQVLHG